MRNLKDRLGIQKQSVWRRRGSAVGDEKAKKRSRAKLMMMPEKEERRTDMRTEKKNNKRMNLHAAAI